MNTEKDLLMYYHSCIKTVGMYTSLSFGALAYSRFYRGNENFIYNLTLVLVSLCLTFVSIFNSYYFMLYFEDSQKELKTKSLENYKYVPMLLLAVNSIIFILGIFTFLREVYSSFSSETSDDDYIKNLLTI